MGDIHVVFGTGPVGGAAIEALAARGLPVRAVSRSPAAVPDGVEHVAGDVSDPAFAADAARDAAAVYQCASPPYARWVDLFPPLQRAIVAAAQAAGARYVSFENVYMYGDTHGAPMTEETPHSAHTRKGRLRAAMAGELQRLADAGDLVLVTARASDYFGPNAREQSPLGARVTGRALAGKSAQVVGDPDQPHSYTYLPDIGGALARLGTDERAVGDVWHVPSAPARTTRQLIAMIAAEIGRDVKVSPSPKLLMRALGLFNPDLNELIEMLYEFEQPFVSTAANSRRRSASRRHPSRNRSRRPSPGGKVSPGRTRSPHRSLTPPPASPGRDRRGGRGSGRTTPAPGRRQQGSRTG